MIDVTPEPLPRMRTRNCNVFDQKERIPGENRRRYDGEKIYNINGVRILHGRPAAVQYLGDLVPATEEA